MIRTRLILCACFHLSVVFSTGCRMFNDEAVIQGRSPLQPARPSPDSVTMEIIWARFPAGDPALNETVWQDIDETRLPPAVQRELANNGLRVGVVAGALPGAIARALHHGESTENDDASAGAVPATQLLNEPIVHGRIKRLGRNQRSEIQASEEYPYLPLLVSGGRELGGKTYQQAHAVYALRVDPQPDRTVALELTPELHYGASTLRYTGGDDGILRQAPLQNREVFDRMRMTVNLGPGEMLVLMNLPDAGSRLGHYFHTVTTVDGPQQKLVLIRLAEMPPSDTFAIAEHR